jgi:class 3 adenylate cyclase
MHNSVADLISGNVEDILLQNKEFTSEIESNIWRIRYNTLLLGVVVFLISGMKRFENYQEHVAVSIGVVGSIAVSIMISYVSGTASYIYLVGMTILMTWMAIISRVRYTYAVFSMILIIGFNNLITSNELLFNLLHQGRELGMGLVGGLMEGQLKLAIDLPINNFILLSTMVLVLFGAYIIEKYSRINFIQNKENEELLLNILPKEIADIKKQDESKVIANSYDNASMLFSDIVGFTKFSSSHKPEMIVNLLNELYSEFDNLTIKHDIEKIKTIGDGYMLASGIPTKNKKHAYNMANMALDMLEKVKEFNIKHPKVGFQIRVGISSGPLVAGVVGSRKFAYDVWGDTVNTASRMESGGKAGMVQISPSTYELIKNQFVIEAREDIVEFKGKGKIQTYFLKGIK